MTTPTSSLGMSHIQTEFGGSNPISLSEYYGVNANVASSGAIRMAQFLGITALAASTPDFTPYGYGLSGTVTAYLYIRSNGQYQTFGTNDMGGITNGTWKTGGGSVSDYDCRLTITSGELAGGDSTNTWLNLATTRSWYVSRSSFGDMTFGGHLEIRAAASPFTVLDNSSVSMVAEWDM